MTSITFTIANNSVTHLGRNLYSTTPPALAELVANSYDAYAENVNISFSDQKIIVADDGIGLNVEQLQNKYAIIGQLKAEEEPPEGMIKRPPMGRKGIGKLAAFSLGAKYTVYSRTKDMDQWITFSLDYGEMQGSSLNSYEVRYSLIDCLPENLRSHHASESGFIVVISELRRSRTQSTLDNLKMQLSRRFYLEKNRVRFDISFEGNPIDLSVNEYYRSLEYVVPINMTDDEIREIFNNDSLMIGSYESESAELSELYAKGLKGWVGTVKNLSQLKTHDYDYSGIVVYINGKIGDENILKNKSSAMVSNNYVVGEIQADFFSMMDDPVISNRQGLDDSIPEVVVFVDQLMAIRNHVLNQWNSMRERTAIDRLPTYIKQDEHYMNWINSLNSSQKKTNSKIINAILPASRDNEIDEDHLKRLIYSTASVIRDMEMSEAVKDLLTLNVQDETEKFSKILGTLLTKVAHQESMQHATLIKNRISAIDQLDRMMETPNCKEEVFQNHLHENPWLINPHWNIDKSKTEGELRIFREKYYKYIDQSGHAKGNYIDLLVFVSEEMYPVIVELKKNEAVGHAKVGYTDIYEQIKRYREAVRQNIPQISSIELEDIPAVFIFSEDSGADDVFRNYFTKRELESLDNYNIKLLKYNQIIRNARAMYTEHLRVMEEDGKLPFSLNLS